MLPTVAAWAVTALLLSSNSHATTALLYGAAVAAGTAVALLLLVRGGDRSRRTAALGAAVLLTAAAATTCTVLRTADLYRGPIPALARAATAADAPPTGTDINSGLATSTTAIRDSRPGAVAGPPPGTQVTVELTITGDPRPRTSHAHGADAGRHMLLVDATAVRVTTDTGGTTGGSSNAGSSNTSGTSGATRHGAETTQTDTPITLIVQERDAASWQGLLPSARVATLARVLPAGEEGSSDTAAALVATGPPRLLAPPNWTQRLAGRLRAGLRQACAGLPSDARTLLPGLVVGDTDAMPDDLAQAFQSTDLVHITAVSGANLSIVLALLLGAPTRSGTAERGGLAAFLGVPLRVAALLGAALTIAFVILCRPEPSVLRAAATGLVSLLALALGRPRQALSALAAGVLLLLLVDPFLARSYGFLLSVLATTGLLTLGRRWAEGLHQRGWPHSAAEAVACTASAQVLCAPVTVLFAPRISLVGIPCNLLAELAVMPATLLGFAALAVAPLSSGVAAFLAGMAGYPTQWLAVVARAGAALPGAELTWTAGWRGTATLALGVLAACYAGRLLFPTAQATEVTGSSHPGAARSGPAQPGPAQPVPAQPRSGPPTTAGSAAGRSTTADSGAGEPPGSLLSPSSFPRPRRMLRLAVAVVLTLGLVVLLLRPPALVRIATGWPVAGARLVMCSVGQGDLLVLPLAGRSDTAVVVDTGPDPTAADDCLRDLGVTRIPLVVLTHFHADHSAGLPGVLHGRAVGAIETTTLAAPAAEAAKVTALAASAHVPLLRASPGEQRTAAPELSWQVLWPNAAFDPVSSGPNDASVSLLVTAGRLRFALLGDLEPTAQAELLRTTHPGPVDVLKVAHHGSVHQDWALASALHPRLALISVGAGNSYGHPSPRTVDRLAALGATVLRTDRTGDIAVLGSTPATLQAVVHPRPAGG
ncbi:ComEC/Rec2 family competence protein [Kitasatospora sp. RB6PN24]|uniref:ComEC/Rec2 family competence protein n=1 Tax=Kitasatospora humi TaxID=2893891 RepID=UPI001E57A952|nr:ComEC/Rec2 family competence protein [Kitasatospora humi]MCC9311168.1 ComEC/Rec2 family competence protein [Kitasatospora humi]